MRNEMEDPCVRDIKPALLDWAVSTAVETEILSGEIDEGTLDLGDLKREISKRCKGGYYDRQDCEALMTTLSWATRAIPVNVVPQMHELRETLGRIIVDAASTCRDSQRRRGCEQ